MQSRGMTATQIEDLLYHRSGMLGVSGISGDMCKLAASGATEAREAVALFAYRLAGEVGRLTSALGGLDGLVFTAGIGEQDANLRADICGQLAWLGIVPDLGANARGPDACGSVWISNGSSTVAVRVVPTNEEAMIARHTQAVLAG